MSLLFGGGGSKAKPQYTGLQIQTSSNSVPVPIVWGANRISPNLIWHDDFKTHKKKQKAGKGAPKVTTYTYSSSLILALCEGEINGVGVVYKDKEQTTLADLGFSLFTGTTPQAPWGYLTSSHPDAAFGYPSLAYLAAANYDLGQSANLPNHTFELLGLRYNEVSYGGGDAVPSGIIDDFLTNVQFGCALSNTMLDMDSLYSGPDAESTGDATYETYCRAMGFAFSPALTDQEEAATTLARWMKLTNSEVVWNGYQLKFIPWGTGEITANGYHYLPTAIKAPVYDLTDDDYISDGDDPISVSRVDLADVDNALKMEFRNRENQYNLLPVEWKDQGLIDQFGPRWGSSITAHEITRADMALTVVTLYGLRQAYQKNRYEFTLSPSYTLLEPADIVTVQDPKLGTVEVYIEEIEEDEEYNLVISGREHLRGVNEFDPAQAVSTPINNNPLNSGVDPGSVNAPILFEPTYEMLAGATPQVWAAVSGGNGTVDDPNWGGCDVYVSTDDITYQAIGSIETPARMGKLTATLASTVSANPVAQTLKVNLGMSAGELVSVTTQEAADAVTLCYVEGGEFLSFEDATLTGADAYDLTPLYRGLYGTTKGARAIGDDFCRVDENIFKYDLPPEIVGQLLYFKFQSYNVFGQTYQDLSDCVAYSYTPTGVGFEELGPPNAPASIGATAGVLSNKITWTAPAAGEVVKGYKIYGAAGSGVAFGSCAVVGTVQGATTLQWYHSLGAAAQWTYYVVAFNNSGESPPTSAAVATSVTQAISAGSDVDVSIPPTNGQVLKWSTALSKWVPGTVSGGGGGGGLSYLGTYVSSSPNTVIDIVMDPAYKYFRVLMFGTVGATTLLWTRVSNDGGATFLSGATDYKWSGSTGDSAMFLSSSTFGISRQMLGTFDTAGWNGPLDRISQIGTVFSATSTGATITSSITGHINAPTVDDYDAIRFGASVAGGMNGIKIQLFGYDI